MLIHDVRICLNVVEDWLTVVQAYAFYSEAVAYLVRGGPDFRKTVKRSQFLVPLPGPRMPIFGVVF